MYLRDRLNGLSPGHFVEIDPGSGEVTELLLELGWKGLSYDLERATVDQLRERFAHARHNGQYEAIHDDFLISPHPSQTVDLVISYMVMEHLDDQAERHFMDKSKSLISAQGIMIALLPGSPEHRGIEDDIAGHVR